MCLLPLLLCQLCSLTPKLEIKHFFKSAFVNAFPPMWHFLSNNWWLFKITGTIFGWTVPLRALTANQNKSWRCGGLWDTNMNERWRLCLLTATRCSPSLLIPRDYVSAAVSWSRVFGVTDCTFDYQSQFMPEVLWGQLAFLFNSKLFHSPEDLISLPGRVIYTSAGSPKYRASSVSAGAGGGLLRLKSGGWKWKFSLAVDSRNASPALWMSHNRQLVN